MCKVKRHCFLLKNQWIKPWENIWVPCVAQCKNTSPTIFSLNLSSLRFSLHRMVYSTNLESTAASNLSFTSHQLKLPKSLRRGSKSIKIFFSSEEIQPSWTWFRVPTGSSPKTGWTPPWWRGGGCLPMQIRFQENLFCKAMANIEIVHLCEKPFLPPGVGWKKQGLMAISLMEMKHIPSPKRLRN